MKLKNGLISLLLVLLSSCGGQNSPVASNDSTLKKASAEQDATALKSSSTKVSLMESLAKLYPNGQLPANRATQAAKDLAQNPAALSLTAPAPTSTNNIQSQKAGIKMQSTALATDFLPVARIQNTTLEGSYFFSIYDVEIENALISHPDWILEGAAFWASIAPGDGLSPVHRFRNLLNGSYLYTIYDSEKASIIRDYSRTFAYEGVAWHARQTQVEGWTPLYRFRNLTNGTYLFSAYEDEKDFIQIFYSDIFELEGVAYYVRLDEPPPEPIIPPSPVINVIAPLVATIGIPTMFVVQGTNLPLDSALLISNVICLTPVQRTETGFSQKCTPAGTAGIRNVSVVTANTSTILATKQVALTAQTLEPAYTGNLPDSGVTSVQCYGAASDALIGCTSAAALALNAKQDGMIGRDVTTPATADGKLGFSYSNVPKPAGGAFAKTECVKDNITGLIWEGKTTSGLRNNANTYTNYDSTSKLQKWDGLSYVSPSLADINAATNTVGYLNYVNSIALCGYSNWRLPTNSELLGLVDYGNSTGRPYTDASWFVNSDITNGELFWSSTPSKIGESEAWFSADILYLSGPRDSSHNVRLVRDTTVNSQVRYSFINGGTEVMDQKTKLIWRRCSEGAVWDGSQCIENGLPSSFTVESALAQAKDQTGWRLPNIKELNSIVDFGASPAIDQSIFSVSAGFGQKYITSTPFVAQVAMSFYIDFDGSNKFYFFNSAGVQYRARLVRNAP